MKNYISSNSNDTSAIGQKIKLVFVSHEFGQYLGHGGIASYVDTNVRFSLDNLLNLEIYVLSQIGEIPEELKQNRRFHYYKVEDQTDVYRLIKKIDPDFVELADWGALGLFTLQKRIEKKEFNKTIFAVYHHAASKECFEWNYRLPISHAPISIQNLSYDEKMQMSCADLHFCPSEFMKNYIVKNYGIDKNVFIVPPVVDILKLENRKDLLDLEDFDIDSYKGDFNILCISRLDGIKNQKYLIEQFLKLSKNNSRVNLFLAGGSYNNIFTGKCFRDEIFFNIPEEKRHNIFFFDYADDKMKCLLESISSVFVLASVFETFSLTLIEESFGGLPVICSKYVGASQAFSSILPELVFDPFQNDDLVKVLDSFLKKTSMEREQIVKTQRQAFKSFIKKGEISNKLDIFYEVRKNKKLHDEINFLKEQI